MPNWEGGAKGAAGGAMAGAAFGPWGAAAGGLIGGGIGLFTGGESDDDSKRRQMLMDYYAQMGVNPPQAGPAAQSAYSGFRQNQTGLVNRLEAMANGQGPSLAKQQFEQATDRNVRSQQAIAASGRGGPMAQLTQANNTAMLGANAAQGSALARTNEQMQAIGQLGGVINQGRNSDETTNMYNTGQTNQMAIQNLDARLRAMGLGNEARLGILQQLGQQNANPDPGMGDQLLAGGAGMYSMAATQRAQQRAAGGGMSRISGGYPGAGGYFTPTQSPNQTTPQNGGVTSPSMFGQYQRPPGY